MMRHAPTCAMLCLASVALLVSGCEESPKNTPTAQPLVEDSRIVIEPARPTPDLPDEVAYICANDDDSETLAIEADFSGAPLILHIEDTVYELQHVAAASGARYESEGVVFWTKDKDATLAMRGGQFRCTVASD